jgi:hypothetical protein
MEDLIWNRLLEIFDAHKLSKFQPPEWANVKATIASELEVENDEILSSALQPFKNRYSK